jgi:hypothetical protein
MRFSSRFSIGIALAVLSAMNLPAQSISGTITGIITDPSGAVIANSQLKLRDMQSGSTRDTTTNSDGYYTFASVVPGAYELTVSAPGFDSLNKKGIALRGGDKLNVNLGMKVGNTSNTVVVTGDADLVVPVDSGENSSRLTSKELENFIQLGSNAAEFIKIMPGFAITGINNKAGYNGQTMGINGNGDGGSQSPLNNAYSYNGLPTNSLDITADGAHVSDPGCNCATPVNPNSTMISEFKISMSNFSAENQKGPGVISSVAKGGGQSFHGTASFVARNAVMNANDWINNYSKVARPDVANYTPGFTIGGPALLPFTNFNKKRDKLFFFTGFQYFYQQLDTGLIRTTVPTLGERTGNFSPAEIAKEGPIAFNGGVPQQINAKSLLLYPGGIIPPSQLNKNTQALMNLYPAPNADPYTNGGFNYVDDVRFKQPSIQWMSRVDYSISDNTKLWVRYNLQKETQLFPIGLWSGSRNAVPYPSAIEGKNISQSVSASLTHVFSPTMTNEFVFGYTFIGFPNVWQDPTKVDRNVVGYNVKGLYKNGVAQIPNTGASGELSAIANQGGFEVGGARGMYADKYMPSFSDNVTKIWSKHTVKAGIFWEHIRNSQPNSGNTNGTLSFSNGNPNTSGNPIADMALGNLNSYSELSFNRVNDISYNTLEGFVQDSWKVTGRLTLELGLRITHFTPWSDNLGFGYSIFDYSKYNSSCTPVQYCGFLWNKRDPSVPLGGFPTRTAYYQPRFGVAFALTSNTMLRGGWGRYYFHSAQFTTGLSVSSGMQQVTLSNNQGVGNNLNVNQLDTIAFNSAALSIGAVDSKNDKSPITDSYSFTLSQRVPWSGLVEVAYVGNQTRDALNTSGGWGSNLNLVPVGKMLSANIGGLDPNSQTVNNFRPLQGFSDINLATNNLFYNYNALQTKYIRTKGNTIISANYTFGKAMGVLSPTLDSFNINNDYGVQANNRKHIFNIAYSYTFRKYFRHKIGGGLANSWQISGITQVQSGINLTGQRGQNFAMNTNAFKLAGTTQNVSSVSLLGTPNIALMPVLTCDPGANLAEHQFINLSCYSLPQTIGQNGPTIQPVLYGPAYFNSDLGIFKNFTITEKKRLQFRVNAQNFLNHPLWSFYNNTNLSLGFNGQTGAVNTPLFGTTTVKQGQRLVQVSVTFSF